MSDLKAFEVIEYKPFIVYAIDEADAINKFENYEHEEEGFFGHTVRELGVVPVEATVF